MAVIRVMPDWLKNQIAAGEVVERPASVLKELVENSLDAGATRVEIEVVRGGIDLIRVTDNGSGMSRDDALLALERHATSKCASMEELRAIATFGFRGEALPSIASISRFTLRTRTASEAVGTQVAMPDGIHQAMEDTAMAAGTEIVVADLFHNVPVRRKFLKTEATEYQACLEVVQRMALSAHRVHFGFVADGRRVISAPPESNPLARVFAILGKKVCDGLFECRLAGRIEVTGFISRPDLRKRASSGLFTFVNGRFVRDRVVLQAVVNGYGTLLGRGEYPYAVLEVRLPPGEVDVNVHPAKSEVRFERSNEVFAAVSRAVRLTLSDAPWVAEEMRGQGLGVGGQGNSPTKPWLSAWAPGKQGDEVESGVGPALSDRACEGVEGGQDVSHSPDHAGGARFAPAHATGGSPTGLQRQSLGEGGADVPSPTPPDAPGTAVGLLTSSYSSLRYMGQYANCFLLAQAGDRLAIVDQHAAHERVLFERLRREFDEGCVTSQPLLLPQLIEVEPALAARAEVRREVLERLGFVVEPFGANTLAVKAVPVLLKGRNPERAVGTLLEELPDDAAVKVSDLFHKPISTLACHLAVRGGDPMEPEEVHALFRQMEGVDLAAFCPHGRPVIVFFPSAEVARWFKRT